MYAMYLRKSRQDIELELQGQGETLARHRETLLRLAQKNRHAIGEIYAEIVSGETIRARPEMSRLLTDVSAGRWEGVYCMEVERLSRGDPADQGRVAEVFTISQTRIITPGKTYLPENDFDVEYFEFSLFMSRREYKTINRRIQAGRMYSVQEGKYIGSRPAYGYRKEKLSGEKGYTLSIHSEEAEVVREIFRLYLDAGMGYTQIARHLTQTAAPAGAEGKGWSAPRVYRLLSNEVYTGKICWGKTRMTSGLDASGAFKRRVTAESYRCYQGRHPAIIPEELFASVQAKMHAVRRSAGRRDQSNLLSGLLVCGQCGSSLHALPVCGRQAASVFCPSPACSTVKNYRAPVLYAVLDTLSPWLALLWQKHAPAALDVDPQAVSRKRLERELHQLSGQMERLEELLEQGVYSVELYRQRRAALSARQEQLQQLWKESNLPPLPPAAQDPASLPAFWDVFASASPLLQNMLLKACVSKILYRKECRGRANGSGVSRDANRFTLVIYPQPFPVSPR